MTRLEALAQNGDVNRLEEAAGLYQGHVLQDYEADATPEFDDWLHRERARLKQIAYEIFDRVIAAPQVRADKLRARWTPIAKASSARNDREARR